MRSRKTIHRLLDDMDDILDHFDIEYLDLRTDDETVVMLVSFYSGVLWASGQSSPISKRILRAVKAGIRKLNEPYTGPEPSEN